MENKELFARLNRIAELEKIIKEKKSRKFGDKDVAEYNSLLFSIPNLSIKEITDYSKWLVEKYKQDIENYQRTNSLLEDKLFRIKRYVGEI